MKGPRACISQAWPYVSRLFWPLSSGCHPQGCHSRHVLAAAAALLLLLHRCSCSFSCPPAAAVNGHMLTCATAIPCQYCMDAFRKFPHLLCSRIKRQACDCLRTHMREGQLVSCYRQRILYSADLTTITTQPKYRGLHAAQKQNFSLHEQNALLLWPMSCSTRTLPRPLN